MTPMKASTRKEYQLQSERNTLWAHRREKFANSFGIPSRYCSKAISITRTIGFTVLLSTGPGHTARTTHSDDHRHAWLPFWDADNLYTILPTNRVRIESGSNPNTRSMSVLFAPFLGQHTMNSSLSTRGYIHYPGPYTKPFFPHSYRHRAAMSSLG
jgi:hypothetical protein